MKTLLSCLAVCAITATCLSSTGAQENEPSGIPVVVVGRDIELPATRRLKKIGFVVTQTQLGDLKWDSLAAGQVIVLPTGWVEPQDRYKALQESAPQFHEFVKRGGGLVVCQPNPFRHADERCTPALLPYPLTFHNRYDVGDAQRVNATHAHYITEDVVASDLPFPADKILEWDKRYKILALGAKSESPSLLVCSFGEGRVVIQTGNENPDSKSPFTDEIFRRMIVWAAGREPARFRRAEESAAKPLEAGDPAAAQPQR